MGKGLSVAMVSAPIACFVIPSLGVYRMSGRNLAGIGSLARSDTAARATLPSQGEPAQEAPATNGKVVDDDGHIKTQAGPRRQKPGLPSSVIHELRTPLTSIHGYAQVLQRSLRDNPRASNALGVVVRESTRMSGMLAALSELAELQSGDVVTSPMDVEVFQIVDGVAHEVARRDEHAHPIDVEGSGKARCNPTLLGQALLHVLTNAIRYSPPGSSVMVTIARADDQTEILVSDEGMGIDPTDAERVYEPFERGANARQAAIRGLGLGLYLACMALSHIGGRMEHRPRDGGGTTFRLVVPGA